MNRNNALSLALLLALLLTPPTVAHAERGDIELTFAPQITRLTSKTMGPLTEANSDAGAIAPTLRAAYAVTPFLDVLVGYRHLQPFESGRNGDDPHPFRVSMDAALVGARAHLLIAGSWLSVYGLVEVEASYLTVTADLNTATGSQGSWSGGVTPEIGLDARWQAFESLAFVFRAGFGYALRLDHTIDAVALETEAGMTQPLDLGAANLSGWTGGITFGARF